MNSQTQASPVVAVLGPTASGKSALGIKLAQQFDGEIVNCDSVQVYKGIEIATARVPLVEREGIPHHLIDFVPPEVTYTAVDWAGEASKAIAAIAARNRLPILVGGTGFYLRALRQPFFSSPETDEHLRQRLSRLRTEHGPEYLHRMLKRLDPVSADRLYPRDWPRVQRAIEFRLQTGRPISAHLDDRPNPPESARRIFPVGLNPPRAEVYTRINERTEAHFAAGLVEEVKDLLNQGVPGTSTALGAHGYRRVVEFLEGKRDLATAIEQTKLDVRHYAKRQITWFRREPGIVWFEGFGDQPTTQHAVINHLKHILFTKTE